VAGTERLATAAAFYSPDAPSYLMISDPSLSPWVATKQATQEGVFIACCVSDHECLKSARQFVGGSPLHFTREFSSRFFGRSTTPQTFAFFISPPTTLISLDH